MKDNKKINNKRANVAFSAIDPYIADNIIKPTEKEVRGQKFIEWGDHNEYPKYIYDLYQNVPTLQSIVNGMVDYICGDEVVSNIPILTNKMARELVKNIGYDLVIYGGSAVNVLRNRAGKVCKMIPLDLRNVRVNPNENLYYYSEDFSNGKSYGRCKMIALPEYDYNGSDNSSVYYFKQNRFGFYPQPVWSASVLACETEKEVTKFHYNSIKNSFASNVIVNFNNGVPPDEMKEEIEEMVYDKYCSADNAGRPLISYNSDKDHAVSIEKLDINGFADRYSALSTRIRQEIFTSFRANPNLFGINTENNGFAQEDFINSYALFNKTVIQPLQENIVDIIDAITGQEGSITISPFTIEFEDTTIANEEVE